MEDQSQSKVKKPVVDQDACVGCGYCASVAPEYFEMAADGKAVVKEADSYDKAKVEEAMAGCAVDAIVVCE